MKQFELPLLWLVNVGASLLVSLVIAVVLGWRPWKSSDFELIGFFWLFAWVGASLSATIWYAFRRKNLRWSYLEGLGWSVLGFGVAALGLTGTMSGGRLWDMAELMPMATIFSLPAILLSPFAVWLWVRILKRVRGAV